MVFHYTAWFCNGLQVKAIHKHSMHNYVIICKGMGLDLSYHHTLLKYLLPKSSNHLKIQSSSIVNSHVSFQLNAQDNFSLIGREQRNLRTTL